MSVERFTISESSERAQPSAKLFEETSNAIAKASSQPVRDNGNIFTNDNKMIADLGSLYSDLDMGRASGAMPELQGVPRSQSDGNVRNALPPEDVNKIFQAVGRHGEQNENSGKVNTVQNNDNSRGEQGRNQHNDNSNQGQGRNQHNDNSNQGQGRNQHNDNSNQGQGRNQHNDNSNQGQGRNQHNDNSNQGQGRNQHNDNSNQGQGRNQHNDNSNQGQGRNQHNDNSNRGQGRNQHNDNSNQEHHRNQHNDNSNQEHHRNQHNDNSHSHPHRSGHGTDNGTHAGHGGSDGHHGGRPHQGRHDPPGGPGTDGGGTTGSGNTGPGRGDGFLFGGNAHSSLQSLEQEIGGHANFEMFPVRPGNQAEMNHVRDDLAKGVTPEISLNGERFAGGDKAIASGKYDKELTQMAHELSQMKDKSGNTADIYMRFGKEMNLNHDFVGSGQDFVKAWQHVHDVFQRAGADNVKMVWCPTKKLDVSHVGNEPDPKAYWPGSKYVDVIGPDGYSPARKEQSFKDIFQPFVDLAERTGKPFMVSETGIDARNVSNKQSADWWRNAFQATKDFEKQVDVIGVNGFYRSTGWGDSTLNDEQRRALQETFLRMVNR